MLTILIAIIFAILVVVAILGLFVKGVAIALVYLDAIICAAVVVLIVVYFINKRKDSK